MHSILRRFSLLVCLGLPATLCFAAAAPAADEQGFESIFDGQSLEGWDGNPQFWSVRDAAITG
ncbi:MAG: DUF1080 domain-containing protein, partial [Planctomycetes bacterium]|nr:DUF1080 domain-containing protein [Planctomycetota bacterium]